MDKFFNNMENILTILILVCFCVLAWASVFIWNNLFWTVVFSAFILIWLWGWEGKEE